MRKTGKIWLIVATVLLSVGLIVFGGAMTVLKWDFTKLSTVKYETHEYAFDGGYETIQIVTNTANVRILPSETQKTTVVCNEQEKINHEVTVAKGTLRIEVKDTRKWYDYIGIGFDSPSITVYVPAGEYGALTVKSETGVIEIQKEFRFKSIDLSASTGFVANYASAEGSVRISTSTGGIRVENVQVGKMDLSVSTGEITVDRVSCAGDVSIKVSTGRTHVNDLTCKNLSSNGSTGDLKLQNVIASGRFSIERSTGDVRLEGCDAGEIFIKATTGDVTGTLLTEKSFYATANTGEVDVPKHGNGGKCEIHTSTGDIKIDIR